jgi:hypothetical protein
MQNQANGRDPELMESEGEGTRRRPQQQRESARETHQQDRLRERSVKRNFEAGCLRLHAD